MIPRQTSRFARYGPVLPLVVIALWGCFPTRGSAQVTPVDDVLNEYVRVLQVAGRADPGSLLIRPLRGWHSGALSDTVAHPWADLFLSRFESTRPSGFRLLHAGATLSNNTALPVFQNDGAMWQGRGLNFAAVVGARFESGPLRMTVQPIFVRSQNRSFDLAPVQREGQPAYAHPWLIIDIPQRMGSETYSLVHPGESTLEVVAGRVVAGVSSRNLWWGPGQRSSIIMSNHAPGLLHAFFATDGPVETAIGVLEAQWVWGRPSESGVYEDRGAGRGRFFTGLSVAWSPLAGLSFGVTRAVMAAWPDGGLGIGDVLQVFSSKTGFRRNLSTEENPDADDPDLDQIASVSVRYVPGGGGFEVYAEYARNDSPWDFRDLLVEPEYTRAYLAGFMKVFPLSGGRLLALTGEVSSLEVTRHGQLVPTTSYYQNLGVPQGYTNHGQVLGSVFGVGGAGQHLSADLYDRGRRVRAFVERRVVDNDYFFETFSSERDKAGTADTPKFRHHVAWEAGVGVLLMRRNGLEVGVDLAMNRDLNRYYEYRNDVWNLHTLVEARWRPR